MAFQINNKHIRDDYISFEPISHIYTVCDEKYTSVTTLIHKYFPKFNPDKIIDKMMKSSNWKDSKYFGMSKPEIKQIWEQNGTQSATKGTDLHDIIEKYYLNNKEHTTLTDDKCFSQFLQFDNESGLNVYRTEWRIFSDDHKVAGSIDIIFEGTKPGSVKLYDWKRCSNLKKDNIYEKGYFPIDHIPNCNYEHYTLQLNIYKYILENYYGIKVEEMALIVFSETKDSYEKIILTNRQIEVKYLLDHFHRSHN
jgi:ATP-dependent exoDNAse (exonuclease V) beta subunit